MKLIKLRMVGGLGNQLFQFVFALILMQEYGYKKIVLDLSDMHKYKENWGFLLFDILDKEKILNFTEMNQSFFLKFRLVRALSFSNSLMNKFGFISDVNGSHFINNSDSNVMDKTLYLDGYFEYFKKIDQYVQVVTPFLRNDLFINIPNNVLVVNVRGGEFIRLGRSSLDDKKIYSELIHEALSINPDLVIHVVSDDLEFSKNLLLDICEVECFHRPDPFANFRTIYSSKQKIIARSTFSKWAGYLSQEFSNVYYVDEKRKSINEYLDI